jgi:DNA-binding CsgD family transcriptional regulator
MVPFHMNGAEVFQGQTIEGDEVQVVATASREGRTFSEVIALADLWRLPAAGLELEEVTPAHSATAVVGLAETWDGRSRSAYASFVWDLRGAPVALLQPQTFADLMGTGNDARRVDGARKPIDDDRTLPELVPAVANHRVIGATAASSYLTRQIDDPGDDGVPPLLWWVYRLGDDGATSAVAWPWDRSAPHRRWRIRQAVSTAISYDYSGRAKPWAKGSSRRWQEPEAAPDLPVYVYHAQSPGSMGPIARGPGAAWLDPTGETATALADGMPASRILRRVITPEASDRRAIGEVVRRLRDVGLTERQAYMLANAEAGFPHDEIARGFGCSVSTVANTVRAARKKLDHRP